ncbi:MAG: TerB N-terminal domain-containing protein [Acidobacteriota bacterium]
MTDQDDYQLLWQALFTIGGIVLAFWVLIKLIKNQSTSRAQSNTVSTPQRTPTQGLLPEPSTPQRTPTQRLLPEPSTPTISLSVTTSPVSQLCRDDVTIIRASAGQLKSISPDELWIPCDRIFQHAGYTISGGLVYFGKGLKSVQRWSEEPSMIDCSLPVDKLNPDREGLYMGYWPSYSQIHPTSRAAFLEWLANGKEDSHVNIGYVFIYFYGLERRALADAKDSATARDEIPAIVTEVKRLVSIYGENNSFRGYANKFLDAIQASQSNNILYRSYPQIQSCSWEIPMSLKIALGQMARDGVPLSAEWALAWAENDPQMPHRTPVQRCVKEFRELFKIRYTEKYGDGLKLKANKTKISTYYHAASPSLGGTVDISVADLPDITAISGPSSKIIEIINACTDELEGYSRYVGRNPENKNSIEATAYLPQPLMKKLAGSEFQKMSSWLEGKIISDVPVTMPMASVLQQFSSIKEEGFGKKDATTVASLLGKINVGIEPDPRFCNYVPKPEQNVVLFKISDAAPSSPSTEYSAATIVLHLASAVAVADGTVDESEERRLEEHLESWFQLGVDEKARLRAHTQWLLTSFPGINGTKKRIEVLEQNHRESLGRFLVGIAQADGYIDPTEMKILTKIYEMLGLDAQSLFSHVHKAAVEPVTVQTADFIKPQGYAIPIPPPKPAIGISIDMSRVEAKLAETVAVSAILNNIFTEDEQTSVPPVASAQSSTEATIGGLDSDSFRFMQILSSKLVWTREELERLASEHSLMLDGTLDTINDASFDYFGGPFYEGDDPIEINAEYAKEIS